jgi:hypothetical protein
MGTRSRTQECRLWGGNDFVGIVYMKPFSICNILVNIIIIIIIIIITTFRPALELLILTLLNLDIDVIVNMDLNRWIWWVAVRIMVSNNMVSWSHSHNDGRYSDNDLPTRSLTVLVNDSRKKWSLIRLLVVNDLYERFWDLIRCSLTVCKFWDLIRCSLTISGKCEDLFVAR